MKAGDVSFETGIWSLGRPVFWESIENKNIISDDLFNLITMFDEIDLANNMSGDKEAIEMIDDMLNQAKTCLKESLKENPDLRLNTTLLE